MDSLGFNKHFAELSKLCEELVDEKINIASEDYDYESLQEWEKNAKKLPQNVIENIFNNDRCKYVYEAGKMNDKDIKVAVFDLIHEKDAEKQREKAKIVKLAVKNEHIALINIIAEKNPNNEEIKKIHDALDKDSTVKLSSFNILL